MDIFNSNQRPQTPQICLQHNQQIILQDPHANKVPLCFVCVQELTGLVPPDQIKKIQQELFNIQKKEINEDKQQLQSALNAIKDYKKNIKLCLDKIIQGIIDRIDLIDKFVINQQELIMSRKIVSIDKLQSDYLIQKQENIQVRNLTKSQLKDFQLKYFNIDNIFDLLNDKSNEVQQNQIKDSRKFKYELIKESRKQENRCRAFAFNKDGNLLIVASFKWLITKEIQKLTNHTDDVFCLYSMKQSDSFVSGSYDKSIILWELDTNGKWTAKTQLKEHKDSILCVLMNKNEDMLISGGGITDKTVKFWRKTKNQWSCQQTVDIVDRSYNLSLNEQENRLISCGDEHFIQVIQLQSQNQWRIVQTIQVVEDGRRLSFLNGDQFIFQPRTKDFLELYNYDTKQKQFQKYKQIQIQSCGSCNIFFPIKFIKDLEIVTVKHGQFLNIFKVNDDNDLMLMQTIEFGDISLFGFCSDDGKYIATLDKKSKEIQIRQLRYLE